jgi:bifunctional non-homologous end joining protein LigD
MSTKSGESLAIGGRQLTVTRPDKVLFPDDGITKAMLIRYYEQAGPRMTPYLAGRPLTLQRFPDGIDQPGFIQKAAQAYYPRWITTATVKKEGGTVRHVVCNEPATLAYLANQACITPHVWLSRVSRPYHPDQMILDFDPSTGDLAPVVEGACILRELLDELSLPAFVRATGSRGLHVVVPLDGKERFETVREFARAMAEILIARAPGRFTLEQFKRKRQDRVLIDIQRNAYAQTAVANYAVRARRGAPIAVPLDWREVRQKSFRSDAVTIRTIQERLDGADPWRDFWQRAGSLAKARHKLAELHAAGAKSAALHAR